MPTTKSRAIDHFPVAEFACHDGTAYPPRWVGTRLARLKRVLETLRATWGMMGVSNPALIVVCGYRTLAYNAQLRKKSSGVAADSQHPKGTAADVRPVDVADVPRFFAMADRMVRAGELDDVGGYAPYPGWVHFDVRAKPKSGHVARWVGKGYGSDR